MKQMPASKSKAHCLSLIDDVKATGEPVIITKRGTPVAKLVAVASGKQDLFGFMAGEFKIVGDIGSPLVPLDKWKVMRK
jgi:prevent-host-death family protein